MKLSFRYKKLSLVLLAGILIVGLGSYSKIVETTQNPAVSYLIDSKVALLWIEPLHRSLCRQIHLR
jgi:hypothetical protein